MKLSNLVVIAASLISMSCSPEKKQRPDLIVAEIDSLMKTIPTFNGVILVASDGTIRYHKAFGFRNYED